jgi:sucrose-phosphate synthase
MNMVSTGDVAALLSGALNVPMVLTGHSLGRNKLEQLNKQGRMTREDINSTYKIMRRIEAEELSLDAAELVITSTRQEIDEQWGLYDGYDVVLERKLRGRIKKGLTSHGSFVPRTAVLDFFLFHFHFLLFF